MFTFLKVRKDFMVFKQRDFTVMGFTVADFLYTQGNVYHYREKRGHFVICFVNSGFPSKTNFT